METETKMGTKIRNILVYINKSKNDKLYLSFKITIDGSEPIKGYLNYDASTKLFKSSEPNILLQFNPKTKNIIFEGGIFETKKMKSGFYVSFVDDNSEAETILQELYEEIIKDNKVTITETETDVETENEVESENDSLPF